MLLLQLLFGSGGGSRSGVVVAVMLVVVVVVVVMASAFRGARGGGGGGSHRGSAGRCGLRGGGAAVGRAKETKDSPCLFRLMPLGVARRAAEESSAVSGVKTSVPRCHWR